MLLTALTLALRTSRAARVVLYETVHLSANLTWQNSEESVAGDEVICAIEHTEHTNPMVIPSVPVGQRGLETKIWS